MPVTVLIEILEKLVTGEVSAVLDNAREPMIIDVGFMPDAVLAAEMWLPSISTCRSRKVVSP